MRIVNLRDRRELKYGDRETYFAGVLCDVQFNDEVSEKKRRINNISMLRKLVAGFNVMGLEASNGFRYLSRSEQEAVIMQRKRMARYSLQNGEIFPYEKLNLIDKIDQKVDKIYCPFVKLSRKKQGA